jgi:type IV secretion system protein TrbG
MPPLFVIGADGEPQIANSRVHQNILIVDRLFGAAELRLGAGERQQTVRIIRTDGARSDLLRQDMKNLGEVSNAANIRAAKGAPS